ncbi:TPA: sulfurtransferase complex subunit TusB [Photobacterium damselae]
MLHTVTSSPFSSQSLLDCLNFSHCGDEIILYQDAVIAAVDENIWLDQIKNSQAKIYFLNEDIIARGLINKISNLINVIDYQGFVDISSRHESQLHWN